MLTNYNLAITLVLAAITFIGFTIYYHQTVLLGFAVFAFFNIARSTLSAFVIGELLKIDQANTPDAYLWVVCYSSLGLICFTLGMWFAWQPVRKNKLSTEISVVRKFTPYLSMTLLFIGIIVYLASPVAYSIPTLRAVWSNFYTLPNLGVLVALAYAITTREYKYIILSLCLFTPLVLSDLVRSGHIGAGGLFMVQVIFVATCWRRVNFRSLILLCITLVLLGSIYINWMSSRYLIRGGYLENYSVPERVLRFIESVQFINPFQADPQFVYDMVKYRLDLSDILAAQVLYQPKVEPYAYGATIASDLFVALIPRFLWPSKPFQAGGSEFVSRYTGLVWYETSVGLPYPFELYANGGVIAVLLGLFFIGWLIARIELHITTTELELPKFLGLCVVLFALTGGENRIVLIIMTLIPGFFGAYMLGKFLTLMNKQGHLWLNQENQQLLYQRKNYHTYPKFRKATF